MTTRRTFAAGSAAFAATAVAEPMALIADDKISNERERKETMKVLMVNGSPRQNGNTARALADDELHPLIWMQT